MSKNLVLMRDIIVKYHPEFSRSADLRSYGIKHAEIFNCERLIEECLAAVGGYDFVDEAGRDFNDTWNSDSKTTTVIQEGHSRVTTIGSVENKIGSLRITIYNPFKDAVDFAYVPRRAVARLKEPNYGKNCHKERIRCRWTEKLDHYNSLEYFRVNTFEALAQAGG